MSGRSGHFSIAALKPGAYLLMPEYRGFVYARKKPGPLPLKAGEHVSDFQLEMTPHAVIAGRAVDEYGDPLHLVMVQAEPVSSDASIFSGNLSAISSGGTADDRGKFRMIVAPGKYYVKAVPQGRGREGPPEIRTDGTAPTEYGPTWYPSAAAKEQAAVVEVQPGSETSIEIRLAHATPQRMLTMSGVVRGIPEGNYVTVQLQTMEGQMRGSQGASVSPDGRFIFSRLEPGTYRLTAMSMGAARLQSPPIEVKLDNDSTNVELHLTGTGELTGALEFVGAPASGVASTEKRTVRLETPRSFGFVSALSSEVKPDGTFHVGGIPPGRFTLHIDSLPENAYISKLQLDGTAVTGTVLDLSQGSRNSKIRVTVSPNGAQISGVLFDQDGNKLPIAIAVVLLVDDPANLELNGDPEHMARVGEDGKYSFHGIRPGKYRLLAIDQFRSPNIDKPEDVKKLAAAAEEFEIKAGDRITKDIKVVGQEDAHAKPKQ
jgi:hypothetical protein